MIIERFDFVFSYWIFAWFIFYQLGIVKYNPKIALIIALLTTLLEVTGMIYFANTFLNIFLFIFINFIMKVIPIFFLLNTPHKINDFYAFIVVFIIYLLWLFTNKVNIQKELSNIITRLKHNKPVGPFMYYMNKI
jgi:hypothetical protein